MPLKKMVRQIRAGTAAIEARHAAAREDNRVRAVIEQKSIESLDELMDIALDCYQHQYKHAVLEAPDAPDLPQDMVCDTVKQLFEQKYGGPRGALRAARLGVRTVIEDIVTLVRQRHLEAWHRYIMETHVAPVDWDAKVAVAREFLRSVSSVVPQENQISPHEMGGRVYEILQKHIERTSFFAGKRPGGGA